MNSFDSIQDNATFIVGHARSGTTLLKALFDGHPQLSVFPVESHFFTWVNSPNRMEAFLRLTSFEKRCEQFGKKFSEVQDDLEVALAKSSSEKETMLSLMQFFFEKIDNDIDGKTRWLEKNTPYLRDLLKLKNWFPQTLKVIYLYRDPRDVFNSIIKKYPSSNSSEFCTSYQKAFKVFLDYSGEKNWFFPVQFEALVRNPEEVMRKLCDFLEIEFSQILLSSTINGIPFEGNSRFGDSLYQVSDSPIGRYKEFLDSEKLQYLESHLKEPMEALGYL